MTNRGVDEEIQLFTDPLRILHHMSRGFSLE
jgi:hypothetical protein